MPGAEGPPDVVERLSRAVNALSGHLAAGGGGGGDDGSAGRSGRDGAAPGGAREDGALLQVWMPRDAAPNGSPILTAQVWGPRRGSRGRAGARGAWGRPVGGGQPRARRVCRALSGRAAASPRRPLHPHFHHQGLPFTVAGAGDLLALFRCVSCRYRFGTDADQPALMGAVGRVFASGQVRRGGAGRKAGCGALHAAAAAAAPLVVAPRPNQGLPPRYTPHPGRDLPPCPASPPPPCPPPSHPHPHPHPLTPFKA
jgi:hypothetical protein